jgi:hypothetical protein
MTSAASEAQRGGAALGTGIAYLFSLTTGVGSLIGGLIGWLSLMNR